ncbi:hypothetical protein [Rhodococcus erythropolis]|nr:hypothetical protein [Rhodococcus erythropolis]MCW2295509.1 hypothetical protein [Rhodococcus erythropolis]
MRTTLLTHAQHGHGLPEPRPLGLFTITGVFEERLTRFAATIQPPTTP